MTETAPATAVAEKRKFTPEDIPAALKAMLPFYKGLVKTANDAAIYVRSATSGHEEKVAALLQTSDNENVTNYRAFVSQAQAQIADLQAKIDANTEKITAYAETLVTDAVDPAEVERKKETFLETRKVITAQEKVLQFLIGSDKALWDYILESNGIEEGVSIRKGGATKGATGIRRPRLVSATINGEDVEKATFGNIAKALGINPEDFTNAAFKAAGTDDVMSLDAGSEVTLSLTDSKGNPATVTFVPKSRGTSTEDGDDTEDDTEDNGAE